MHEGAPDIQPVYDFSGETTDIPLRSGEAVIKASGKAHTGETSAFLRLSHRPGILFSVSIEGAILSTQDIQSLEFDSISIPGFATETSTQLKIGQDEHARSSLVWLPKNEPVQALGGQDTQLARVVFHLVNFKDILGTERTSEKRGTVTRAIRGVNLSAAGWSIRIQSLYESCERFKKLKSDGGFQLTHVGELTRQDGAVFSGRNAGEVLETLRFFLSFAKGGWCNPVCAVGFDESGAMAWESWSSPSDSWNSPGSWFDPRHCEQLVEAFPGFYDRWQNEGWRSALRESIYWYVKANNSLRGIDAGIILTQAALERLAFEYAVKDRRLVAIKGFKALWASDKFRLLFSSLGIRIDLPQECEELIGFGRVTGQVQFEDSPHALTEIRNSLVHPEHKHRGQYGKAYYEAWSLGLWYLELCLLRLCGYQGTYGNRLRRQTVGEVDAVPWGSPTDSRE